MYYCYSIKCKVINNKKSIVFQGEKICSLSGVDNIGIGPDRTGRYHGSDQGPDHRKKGFKEKKSKEIKSFMS